MLTAQYVGLESSVLEGRQRGGAAGALRIPWPVAFTRHGLSVLACDLNPHLIQDCRGDPVVVSLIRRTPVFPAVPSCRASRPCRSPQGISGRSRGPPRRWPPPRSWAR